ncbi:MAG TPA: IS200/IS605 family transposase [Anaerolineales bacterium]
MPHYRLFYHFIWSTKNRQPWIVPELEKLLFDSIRSKVIGLDARVLAVNACRDHVHLVASVPPTISLSNFIGQVKGISSLRINESGLLAMKFNWQEEYSVFSLDETSLSACIFYTEKQKEHHANPLEIRRDWE